MICNFCGIDDIQSFTLIYCNFYVKIIQDSVVNYDTFMKKYVFGIELTKDEFFSQLKTRNINDVLEYSLNDDYSVITYTICYI